MDININTEDNTSTVVGASGYTIVNAPILRTLVVCKMSDLPDPPNREKNFIYLVYDMMQLYVYQSLYTDPFCIVPSLGEDKEVLTDKMLYITLNGEMYSVSNHIIYRLGFILDVTQLELLELCGTVYFMNAEGRYFDRQKRILQLPFQNGTYQLDLSLAKDIKIDEDTVIRFDPEKEQFYLGGKEYQFEDKLNNIGRYSGINSTTVLNDVDAHTFRSQIRVSSKEHNSVQALKSGLFVSTYDLAKVDDYLAMIELFDLYKRKINGYIAELLESVAAMEGDMTMENIIEIANQILHDYKSDIDDMYDNYEELEERLLAVENSITAGFNATLEEAKDEIKNYVDQVNSPWERLLEPDQDSEITGINSFNPSSEIEIRGQVLQELRSNLKNIRDPEKDYSKGLSDEELEVQSMVLDSLENAFDNSGIE